MSLDGVRMLDLFAAAEPRGTLVAIEAQKHVPFPIERVFFIFDVPASAERGGHAHPRTEQVLVAIGGRVEVELFDGRNTRAVVLDSPSRGLALPPMIWTTMQRFETPQTVLLVLASQHYQAVDVLRDRDAFIARVANAERDERDASGTR